MSEGRLFARSIAFVEKWIADLTAHAHPKAAVKHVDAVAAPATATPAKAPGKAPAKGPAAPAVEATSMSKVNLVVGRVLDVAKHPESAKLYIEKIDLGEEQPRTILSGLQEQIKIEDFTGKLVLVVANLEPRKLGGITSEGMVLCASSGANKEKVELLKIPEGTPVGERVVFPGHDQPPEPVLKKKLAKHWEDVAPQLATDAHGNAVWGTLPLRTTKGPITSSFPDGHIS